MVPFWCREVEDFKRILNSDWPKRMQELLSSSGQERRTMPFSANGTGFRRRHDCMALFSCFDFFFPHMILLPSLTVDISNIICAWWFSFPFYLNPVEAERWFINRFFWTLPCSLSKFIYVLVYFSWWQGL